MWIFIPTLEEITVAEGNPMYRSHEGVLYCMEEDGWQLLQYPFSKKEETYRVADFATSIYADNLGHDEEGNELLLKKLYIGDCYGVSFDSECSISKVMCSVIPDATNPYYKLESNILLSKDGKIVEQIPKYITGTLTIPEGVEKIVCYAGEHMKMQEIVFPKSLKVIGGMAFAYCHSLEKISLPDNLEIVENRAFMNCEKLDNVTIPGEVTELTELVFGWCEGLTRLAIPSNVKKIDDKAFVNCISLKEVYYGGTEEEWLQLNADREYGYYSAQIMFNMDHLCEHNFEWKVDVEATETITGLKHEECTICGYKQNEGTEIDKLSPCHEMERVELVQQTCEEDGNIEYFKCTICDKCFLDMEGTQEIAIEDTILKATGHSWDDGGVKVPTCTEGGYTIYTCSCGETYITDEVTATGHKYVDGVCSVCGENDPNFTNSSFVDVKEDKWYAEAVLWASENGYVAGYKENDGTLTFRPNNKATRAESVTFLWRIAGEAEPDEETENPFTDIKEGKWYYEEVLWAYENKVAVGYEEVDGTFTFKPDNNCTRAEILAFICRVKGNPEASGDVENPFTDIKDSKWYYNDVMWAVEQGIVSGYEENDGTFTFRPNDLCTRAEIVQMLYRAFADTE